MTMDKNITWHPHKVSRNDRLNIKGHRSLVVWFTGLSGSGKSTIAQELDSALHNKGMHSYVLDGDNIRYGLNKNLGFSANDRKENVRRIGEVAKLFVDAGVLTITAFISPFRGDRDAIRSSLGEGDFIEIYTKCSIDECTRRDPKGLYQKALKGEIKDFTGIGQNYEEPRDPEIVLETDKMSVDQCVDKIVSYLNDQGIVIDKG